MDMPTYSSIHELQTTPTLVIIPIQSGPEAEIGIYEFVSKSFARCPINTLYWLSYFKQPRSLSKTFREHPNASKDIIESEVSALLDAKFLIPAGSQHGCSTQSFATDWEWDIATALYHFTVQDNPFMHESDAKQQQVNRLKTDPPPAFYWSPTHTEQLDVSAFVSASPSNLMQVMRSRRTNRTSIGTPAEMAKIAKCLYAGLGIVGTIKATSGDVPLSMTPSGGARNPYEAFVIVKRCNGICPGVYHYCAADQILEKVSDLDPDAKIADMFGNQDWLDDMAVVVVLVAIFERTMWKYQDPNAYRVLLIEAGHIGQNMMLMATEQGYTVCPTAAMSHSRVSAFLGLKNKFLHAPIYALSIDHALPSETQIAPLFQN